MKVHFNPITPVQIWKCFTEKRHYIGIHWNLWFKRVENNTVPYDLIEEFLDFVASKARRWWTPYWFLNLLHLFGNDNSIVRCRNHRISDLHRKLTNGIMIRDIKEKWGTLRIYGSFTKEIEDKLRILEDKVNQFLEPY